jgi:hypothetical protein
VPKGGAAEGDRELARLIRRSRELDRLQKRHWQRVLPHLSPLDRLRLRTILESEQQGEQIQPPT